MANPLLTIDAAVMTAAQTDEAVLGFVEAHRIDVLNVAGPRSSSWPAGEGFARRAIAGFLGGARRSEARSVSGCGACLREGNARMAIVGPRCVF